MLPFGPAQNLAPIIPNAPEVDINRNATSDAARIARTYPKTKFIPYQESIMRFILNSTLFNSFTFDIFVYDREFGTQTKYVQRKSLRNRTFAHLDDTFRNQADNDSEADKTFGKDLATKISKDVAKASRRFRYYFIITALLQLMFILKDFAIIILKYLPESSPYRLIDCFLLGRLIVTGTFTQVSQRFGLHVNCFQFIWSIQNLYLRPPIRLDCLEFLLYNSDQVEAIEFECCSNVGPIGRPDDTWQSVSLNNSPVRVTKSYQRSRSGAIKYPVFQYREETVSLTGDVTDSVRFRKNRSLESWSKLMQSTISFFRLFMLTAVACGTPVVYCMATVMITKQGFELNYSTCTNLIRSLDEKKRSQLGYIHLPEVGEKNYSKSLSLALDWTDIISFDDPYNLARLLADIFQTSVILNLSAMSFLFNTYIALMEAGDVENYLDFLEVELAKLISDLRRSWNARSQMLRLDSLLSLMGEERINQTAPDSTKKFVDLQMMKRITDLQAQLIDFWALVARYNYLVGRHTSFVIMLWLVGSALSADYLLAPNGIVYYEVVSFQIFTTGYFLGVVGRFASITRRIRRLYPMIASAMAYEGGIDSKRRWSFILNYFYPKPLYCFTITEFTISWHFCLQVSSGADKMHLSTKPPY